MREMKGTRSVFDTSFRTDDDIYKWMQYHVNHFYKGKLKGYGIHPAHWVVKWACLPYYLIVINPRVIKNDYMKKAVKTKTCLAHEELINLVRNNMNLTQNQRKKMDDAIGLLKYYQGMGVWSVNCKSLFFGCRKGYQEYDIELDYQERKSLKGKKLPRYDFDEMTGQAVVEFFENKRILEDPHWRWMDAGVTAKGWRSLAGMGDLASLFRIEAGL